MNASGDWYYHKNNHTYTWDNLQKNKNYGGWTYSGKNDKINKPFESLPTNEDMKASVLSRTDEEGFFSDSIEWLEKMAPRKVRSFLKSLCHSDARLTYDDLCEAVYKMGFRASEILERRMALGQANEWVRKYFEDFPLGR